MIQVEGLTKRYARAVAVDKISFSVTKGQIVGFLGPNGAGKTTTMRMLTCFMPPSEGTANVAGYDIVKSPMEVKKRIGYLPETPPLYPDMEVGEYLQFVARLKNVPSANVRKRSEEVAERCSIKPEWNKLISKLSKGYRQRVGLAQAIIHNPDVLILDEPTSGFDPKQIIETRDLIKSLAGDHTIILSTHILQEVEAMCESVVIISKGKVVATDRVETLTARMLGGESAQIELSARSGELSEDDVLAVFEKLSGVTKVIASGKQNGRLLFEIDAASGNDVRPEIARAAVEAGWNLHKLQSASISLEDIFLQLTGSTTPAAGVTAAGVTAAGAPAASVVEEAVASEEESQ